MTLELWVFWGMLGCLGLGYALGWWARREEVARWKAAWKLEVLFNDRLGAMLAEDAAKSDADAVERLIRETR